MTCISFRSYWLFFCIYLEVLNLYFSLAEKLCGDPPEIKNADAIHELQNTTEYPIGTKIGYHCHDGYVLNTIENSYAVCLNNSGTVFWQPASISCNPMCNNVPVVINGKLKLEGHSPPFMPGDSIPFICDPGYAPNSQFPKVKCVAENDIANWTETKDVCKVSVVSCNDPGYIENAQRVGDVFTFPNSITYVCNEGYKLIGTATRYCSPKAQWLPSSPPFCEAIYCPILSDPENGKVISSLRQLHAIATYECERYFNLSGSSKRVCREDGSWSGTVPTCKEITCLDPGAPPHVRVILQKHTHTPGELVIYQCKYGSLRTSSKCLETGEWSTRPPLCPGPPTTDSTVISSTQPIDDMGLISKSACDDPGTIKNGERIFIDLSVNSTVTYTCDDGYELRGKATLSCLHSGKWDLDKLPICVKPLSVIGIVGIVFSVLLLIGLIIGGYFWYRWREKKIRGYGDKSKALTTDATDLEEIAGLDCGKKPIPVTVL